VAGFNVYRSPIAHNQIDLKPVVSS